MPKVDQEYINTKKSEILNAAFIIFKKKPLYEINMLDVIKQANLSKGGIYRYFRDIDDIIVALINRETSKYDYRKDIEEIINSSHKYETQIQLLFEFLGKHIDENADTIGKIQFELTVLQTTQPERAEKILSRLIEYENGKYLIDTLHEKIAEGITIGELKPGLSVEDIYTYIRVYVEGLIKIVVSERCYGNQIRTVDAEKMIILLAQTIIGMGSVK